MIDDLADAGIRFTRAWAEPSCTPTRATMMTGVHPFRHGLGFPININNVGVDVTSFDMLAAEFAVLTSGEAGLFGKWHVGSLDESSNGGNPAGPGLGATDAPHPITAGFERFYGTLEGEVDDYHDWYLIEYDESITSGSTDTVLTHATPTILDEAETWIAGRKGDWLAFVMFHAPHSPWTYADLPADCLKSAPLTSNCAVAASCSSADLQIATYQTQLECTDWYIGEFLDALQDTYLLEDTLIFVVGDNGTPASLLESAFANGGGKLTVYETGLRVPLIVADGYQYVHQTEPKAPLVDAAGRVATLNVHVVDLYGTILAHAGAKSLPALAEDTEPFDDCLLTTGPLCGRGSANWDYSEQFSGAKIAAVRFGGDKLRVTYNAGYTCLYPEFFETISDPFETTEMSGTWTTTRMNALKGWFLSSRRSTGGRRDQVTRLRTADTDRSLCGYRAAPDPLGHGRPPRCRRVA